MDRTFEQVVGKNVNGNRIKPFPDTTDNGREGTLSGLTAAEITDILGFEPNVADDPDKVKYSWGFTVNGCHCAVWDYKRSWTLKSFSTGGSATMLKRIFGDNFQQ